MSAIDIDVVILGTGPAGLQAAIHAARKKVSVLVLGPPAPQQPVQGPRGKTSAAWAK